jgi:predicted nucleotide-binding protein
MARKKAVPQQQGSPEVDPATGIGLLQSQLEKGRALISSRPLSSDAYGRWELLTRNYLEKAFGNNSPNVNTVMDIGKYGAFPMDAEPEWWERQRVQSLQTQLERIEGLIELLNTELQLQGGKAILRAPLSPGRHRIFLVHGHDEAALHETARFLERLDQNIVILREQPNKGRTIIEKFEDYGDVGFAVVLLTADDRGGPVKSSSELQQTRARQNVILEFGYFLGRLGRDRVCALYTEEVEIPSDYSGVIYIKLDSDGAWRLQLAKELRAAGFPVDMNKAV